MFLWRRTSYLEIIQLIQNFDLNRAILHHFPDHQHRERIREIENLWTEIALPESEIQRRLRMFGDSFESALTAILSAGLDKQKSYKKLLDDRISSYEEKIRENQLFLDLSRGPEIEVEMFFFVFM